MNQLQRGSYIGRIGRLLQATAVLLACNVAWAQQPTGGDFQTIRSSHTGQLTVWQYSDSPNIYIFDFPSLTQQGRTFNRITQLTEQQTSEPYPRPLTNEELARYMDALRRTQADFAFGHDILVHELVTFFNLADTNKVQLNPEEIQLRDFLVAQGFVRPWRGFYQAIRPNVVILSVPQTQERHDGEPKISEGARFAVLSHELAHGEYYANQYYAKYCQRFWNEKLSASQRDAFKAFLTKYNYSLFSEDLLVNEMQAYLMFTPDQASFNAAKLGVTPAELQAMRQEFRQGKPPTRLPLMVD